MATDHTISPPPYLQNLLEDAMGRKAISWTVPDCGLSSAHRFSVKFEDDSRAFVKAATDEWTERWLRTEHLVLSSVRGAFMPSVITWIDEPGTRPVLVSEDLSHAYWPASHHGVTWRKGDFDLLFSSIEALSSHIAPPELFALQNRKTSIWSGIARDPAAFLQLGLCSEAWFIRSVGALIGAERNVDLTGNFLVHGDIRSDNVCILGSKIIFVDWSHASRGYGLHDLASVLPTLYLEGGPDPYQIMPNGGGEAALSCAGLIERLSTDHGMPQWLRRVFRQLIAIELEWAAQCLNLDEPDGIRWRAVE